jgi:hypothetical protein
VAATGLATSASTAVAAGVAPPLRFVTNQHQELVLTMTGAGLFVRRPPA